MWTTQMYPMESTSRFIQAAVAQIPGRDLMPSHGIAWPTNHHRRGKVSLGGDLAASQGVDKIATTK
jgi:hypothetical protein